MTTSQQSGSIVKTLRKKENLTKTVIGKVFGNDTMHRTISG
jgi:hypothetical protein